MKTIIAGSRNITDKEQVFDTIFDIDIVKDITEVVSGRAKGIDRIGEEFAAYIGVPVKTFEPNWKDLKAYGAIIKKNKYGQYNANAGKDRNIKMAEYADALIAIWDGKSPGTKHMIEEAEKRGLKVYIHNLSKE